MPAYLSPSHFSRAVVVAVVLVCPVTLGMQPNPLHDGAGDQVHVSLALEAPHLHVATLSLIICTFEGFLLTVFVQYWLSTLLSKST